MIDTTSYPRNIPRFESEIMRGLLQPATEDFIRKHTQVPENKREDYLKFAQQFIRNFAAGAGYVARTHGSEFNGVLVLDGEADQNFFAACSSMSYVGSDGSTSDTFHDKKSLPLRFGILGREEKHWVPYQAKPFVISDTDSRRRAYQTLFLPLSSIEQIYMARTCPNTKALTGAHIKGLSKEQRAIGMGAHEAQHAWDKTHQRMAFIRSQWTYNHELKTLKEHIIERRARFTARAALRDMCGLEIPEPEPDGMPPFPRRSAGRGR